LKIYLIAITILSKKKKKKKRKIKSEKKYSNIKMTEMWSDVHEGF